MELSGSQLIRAPQQSVWGALNDVDILKASIPGCETIEQESPTRFKAVVATKVGPVSARFRFKLEITQSTPPDGYTVVFDGQGGVAGVAKGNVDVSLSPEGESTQLMYVGRAQIGGKLAQIGARLVDLAARKTIDEFFAAFNRAIGQPTPADNPSSDGPTLAPTPDAAVASTTLPDLWHALPWVVAAVATVLAVIGWLR